MKAIVISVRGFGLAALVASAPAAAQVILNASSWVPPGHPITATMLVPFCADIEKATAARVKCNILPKAPVGAVQTFDGVKDGLMDLSFVTHGYTPGRFALTDAPEFPFMGDTAEATAVAYQRIYERMLAGANEHRDVVLLSVFTHGPGQMYNTKRAISALKDLDGLKIRVGGGLVNEITRPPPTRIFSPSRSLSALIARLVLYICPGPWVNTESRTTSLCSFAPASMRS